MLRKHFPSCVKKNSSLVAVSSSTASSPRFGACCRCSFTSSSQYRNHQLHVSLLSVSQQQQQQQESHQLSLRKFHSSHAAMAKFSYSADRKARKRQEVFAKKSVTPIKYTEVEEYKISRPLTARKLADDLQVSSFDLLRFMPQAYLVTDLIPVREAARLAARIGTKSVKVFDPLLESWVKPPMSRKRRQNLTEEEEEKMNEEYANMPSPFQIYSEEEASMKQKKKPKKFVQTPPVVTMMGHTDHGKSTLLDAIRDESTVDKEHGGITQHIGAFEYTEKKNKSNKGRKITFIDTPGHAAFAKMRSTGARVTDVVVLLVAADDGVMPQTRESIKVAQKEGVPIIVALNKMDKQNAFTRAQLEQQLMEAGIVPDTHGGDSPIIPISALKKEGIDDIMEAIYLQADLLELKAPTDAPLEAVVVECRMHRALGMATTVIVKQGVLKPNTWLMAGTTYGKVKSVKNFQLKAVKEAIPGMAVEVTGFDSMPEVGSIFREISHPKMAKQLVDSHRDLALAKHDEREARQVFEQRKNESEEGLTRLDHLDEMTRDDSLNYSKADTDMSLYKEELDDLGNVKKYMPVLFRADAEGSIDAFNHIISEFPSALAQLRIVEQNVGEVTERDVDYARATGSQIICMNVNASKKVTQYAEQQKVTIASFKVIYHLIDYLKKLIISSMDTQKYWDTRGTIDVIQPFQYEDTINGEKKLISVAGGKCSQGEFLLEKNNPDFSYHVKRKDRIILENCSIHSLKHFKTNVTSLKKGQECGCAILGYEPKPGDKIFCEEMKSKKMTWEDLLKADSKRQRKQGKRDKM